MNRKTIGYLRVSTDDQAENGFGLDVQKSKISSFANLKDWQIDEFIIDDGYSGATLDRPGLQILISMIRRNEVERVIILRFDRLMRDPRRFLELVEDVFEKHNITFLSVMEQLDTKSASGRLMMTMMAGFGQYERTIIKERTSAGRVQKALKGGRGAGRVPFGYKSIEGKTEIDDEIIKVVKMIFAWHNSGLSLTRIADELNCLGVRTSQGGRRWYASTVKAIIENPIYKGNIRWKGDIVAQNLSLRC